MNRGRNTWRPDAAAARTGARLKRRLGLAAAFLMLIGAAWALFHLIQQPFRHVRPQVVFLAGTDPSGILVDPGVNPPRRVDAERLAMRRIESRLRGRNDLTEDFAAEVIHGPSDLRRLGDRLSRVAVDDRDVLIVSVVATGIVEEGDPRFCWNFGLPDPAKSHRLPVRDLLTQLLRRTAGQIVVLVDSGAAAGLPDRGLVENDFVDRVAELLRREPFNNRRLWLLCSHSPGEVSHLLGDPPRSVFSFFLEQGLTGAADFDGDKIIDLYELSRYSVTAVSRHVADSTRGVASQTPRLVLGGAAEHSPEFDASARLVVTAPAVSGFTPGSEATSPDGSTLAGPDGNTPGAAPEKAEGQSAEGGDARKISRELLGEAWKIDRELSGRTVTGQSPGARAPHLWRKFRSRLQTWTALLATQGELPVADRGELEQLIAPLRSTIDPESTIPRFSEGTGMQLVRRLNSSRIGIGEWPSLALSEFQADDSGVPLAKDLVELLQRFDRYLVAEDRSGFDKWLGELPASARRSQELDGIDEISQLADVEWNLFRDVLNARRNECQVAARSLGRYGLVQEDLAQARLSRREAERLLRDGLRSERAARAKSALNRARSLLSAAQSRLAEHDRATTLVRGTLSRVREYIDWWWISSTDSLTAGPDVSGLDELLVDLRRLCEIVESPTPNRLSEMRELAELVEASRRKIESAASSEAQQALRGRSPARNDSVDGGALICGLMSTTLLDTDSLSPLVLWHREYQRFLQDQAGVNATGADAETPPRVRPRNRKTRLASLLVNLARLMDPGPVDASNPDRALNDLDSIALTIIDNPRDFDRPTEFESRWRNWTETLESRLIASAKARLTAGIAPHALSRVLSLLPLKEESETVLNELVVLEEQIAWRDLLDAEARALIEARDDASPADFARLTSQYQKLVALFDDLPDDFSQRKFASPAQERVTLAVEPTALSAQPKDQLAYQALLTNLTPVEQQVWLLVDYDPHLIEFVATDDTPFHDQTQLEAFRQEWNRSDRAGREAELLSGLSGGRSLRIAPNSDLRFTLKVRRRGARDWPTRLIVKAALAAEGALVEAQSDGVAIPLRTLRREIEIPLPLARAFDLSIAAPESIWSSAAGGGVLYPFPNRRDSFQARLTNTGKPRSFDVRLYSLQRPPENPTPEQPVSAALADEWLQKLQLGPQLARVTGLKVPADGSSRSIPFTGPAPLEPLAETKPIPAELAQVAAKTGPLPGYAPAPGGLLFVVTDVETGDSLLHVCHLMVQRPRRYVAPRVEYSPDDHLVSVVLKRRPGSAADHAIGWEVELARSSADAVPRRVVARLEADATESKLTLAALPGAEPLQLRVAVDGYPRAFLYKIPAAQPPGEVEEETSTLAIRILDPQDGTELHCPLESVDALVEIDAPPGGMPELGGYWEIGIDRDRDRELEDDLRLKFAADRSIRSYVSGFTDDGRFVIDTRAGDFKVSLPLAGVCNERPQLIAHVVVAERESWSSPVELILDGQGPKISRVAVGSNRRVIVGDELEVSALASDGELGGVARVDVAFDLAGTGEFVKEPPPVLAVRGEEGRWKAALPTAGMKPGQYLVLLRATDRVGNAGPIVRQPLLLETQADLDRDRAAQRIVLRGRVEYFGAPVSEAEVSLTPVEEAGSEAVPKGTAGKPGDAKKPLSAQTDAEGKFIIKQVPFGAYKLKATALYRNKRRELTREITVDETSNGQAGLLELPQ